MAGEDAVSTCARKALKMEDELDNLPLAVSRGKNASASKVKKEEDDDDSDNMPIAHSRAKKGNEKQKGAMNSSAKASKVKKDDSDDDFETSVKKKKSGGAAVSARTSKVKKIKDGDLDDVKKTKKSVIVKAGKTGTAKEDKAKKERKVYDLPGQKHDPPAERDALRIFYESLYEQIPTSDMAATWLMEWGLLPLDVATKVFEKKQDQKLKSPVKTTSAKRMLASPAKKATPSSAKKPGSTAKNAGKKPGSTAKNAGKTTSQKKRKTSSDSDDDDDDFVDPPKAKTKRQMAFS